MGYNTLSILSVIFGIIGMISSFFSIWGVIPCFAGLILGIIALTDYLSEKLLSVLGIISSVIGLLAFFVVMIDLYRFGNFVINNPVDIVKNYSDEYQISKNEPEEKEEIEEIGKNIEKEEKKEGTKIKYKPDDKETNNIQEIDGIKVNFIDYKESYGSEYNKPKSGNIFVLLEFEIENNSNEDIAVSSLLSFETYVDDYAADLSLSALMENENGKQLDGSIIPGKKMKGCLGYEVPENWNEIEVEFTYNVWENEKFIFEIYNENKK